MQVEVGASINHLKPNSNLVIREKECRMYSATYSCVGLVRMLLLVSSLYLRQRVVPLFWAQSGYSLKPAPVLSADRNHEQNLSALRRHFAKIIPRYGTHVRVGGVRIL